LGVNLRVADSPEAVVRQAEVLITATTTTSPIVKHGWLAPGSFYAHVSGYEAEYDVITRADKVVVDDWNTVKHRMYSTVALMWRDDAFADEDLYAELGEIVIGHKPGRENEQEIIIFSPIGMGLHDLAVAQRIYQRALDNQDLIVRSKTGTGMKRQSVSKRNRVIVLCFIGVLLALLSGRIAAIYFNPIPKEIERTIGELEVLAAVHREQAEVQPVRQRGCCNRSEQTVPRRYSQHRHGNGWQVGGEERDRLHELHGFISERAGAGVAQGRRQKGKRGAAKTSDGSY
jgi:hypothetical protein